MHISKWPTESACMSMWAEALEARFLTCIGPAKPSLEAGGALRGLTHQQEQEAEHSEVWLVARQGEARRCGGFMQALGMLPRAEPLLQKPVGTVQINPTCHWSRHVADVKKRIRA